MDHPQTYDSSKKDQRNKSSKTKNLLPELTINTSMINLVEQIESPVVKT